MTQIAIFASGRGSNARNIIEQFQTDEDLNVRLIITNKADAPVLDVGKQFDIETLVINRKSFYETETLRDELTARGVDFLVLAGFLWLVPPYLIEAFPARILNIHPALLPKYGGKGMYGMKVHEAVCANKETETGITIHFVNERYDEGNIVFQTRFAVTLTDTPETVAEKIHELEYYYFPIVIRAVIRNEI